MQVYQVFRVALDLFLLCLDLSVENEEAEGGCESENVNALISFEQMLTLYSEMSKLKLSGAMNQVSSVILLLVINLQIDKSL